MKIKTNGESIQKALDAIVKLAAPTTGNVNFIADGKRIKLSASADTSYVIATIPGEVKEAGETSLLLASLKDATKGLEDCAFNLTNAALLLKAEGYSASLATVDPIPVEGSEAVGELTHCDITVQQGEWLLAAAKAVNLKPTPLMNAFMPIAIVTGKSGTTVACYDTNHAAWRKTKEVTGDFQAVFPATTLIGILEVMQGLPFKMTVSQNNIVVKSKMHEISLAIPNVTDGMPSIQDVMGLIKSVGTAKAEELKFNAADMVAFFGNARAVVQKERPELQVTSKGKAIELTVSTIAGKVQRTITGTGPSKTFKIDAEQMQELIAKAPAEAVIGLVDGAYVFARLKDCTSIVSLNQ